MEGQGLESLDGGCSFWDRGISRDGGEEVSYCLEGCRLASDMGVGRGSRDQDRI